MMGLPGSILRRLDGTEPCAGCGAPATKLVQGETDSFGAEYNAWCDDCDRRVREEDRKRRANAVCDWCKTRNGPVTFMRDVDEGMSGPVYQICGPCRQKHDAYVQAELDYYDVRDGC